MKQKIITYLSCIGIVLFITSCKETGTKDNANNRSIKLPEKAEAETSFNDYFSLESIVPIETNDSVLIELIRRVILHDDKAFILNGYKEVVVINNKTGKYIAHIRNIGNGPGEYSQIMDITLNEDTKELIIYSDNQKILFYDKDFNFKEEVQTEGNLFERFICLNNKLYFYNPLSASEKNIIEVYDTDKNEWQESTGEENYNFSIRLHGVPIVKSHSVWYTSPLKRSLTKLTDNTSTNEYELDIPTFGKAEQLMAQQSDTRALFKYITEENICYAITSVKETSKSIYCKTNLHPLLLIDKTMNRASYLNILQDSTLGISGLEYFPHDSPDERIMFILTADKWVAAKNPSTNMPGISPDTEIDSYSNPLLLFYTEKE